MAAQAAKPTPNRADKTQEQVTQFMKNLWFFLFFFILLLMIASFGLVAEA